MEIVSPRRADQPSRWRLQETKPYAFILADQKWLDRNAGADNPWPVFSIKDGQQEIGLLYLKQHHWDYLVIKFTKKQLQHLLLSLKFWASSRESGFVECWPAQDTIAEKTGMSRSTVQRALKTAVKAGWLTLYPRRHSFNGNAHNSYGLTVPREIMEVGLYDSPRVTVKHEQPETSNVMRQGDTQDASFEQGSCVKLTPSTRQGDALTRQITRPKNLYQELGESANAPEEKKEKVRTTPVSVLTLGQKSERLRQAISNGTLDSNDIELLMRCFTMSKAEVIDALTDLPGAIVGSVRQECA